MFTYFVSYLYQQYTRPLGTQSLPGWKVISVRSLITTEDDIENMIDELAEGLGVPSASVWPTHFQVLDRQPIRPYPVAAEGSSR